MADTYISAMMTNPGTILPQIPIPTILRTLQIHQNYSRHHIYPTRNTNTITSATKPTRCHTYITITWYIQYYLRNASIRCTWNNHNRKHTKKHKSRFNHQQICHHTQKKCFKWWGSHVNNETTDPKYEWIQINFISKSHKKKKKHFMNIMKKKHMEQLCLKAVKEECELSCGSRRLKFDFH